MNFSKHAALLAAVSVMAPLAAFAQSDTRDVVRDKYNNVVKNTFGHCVRTKWDAGVDGCGVVAERSALELTREARTVYFDFNKSSLKPSERAKLDRLAADVKLAKQVESVDIVGHADRIGKTGYNDKLSQKRAQTVRAYLAAKGLRTRNVRLEAVGEKQSVTSCSDSLPRAELISCLAEDRRVEVQLNLAEEVVTPVATPARPQAVKKKPYRKATTRARSRAASTTAPR